MEHRAQDKFGSFSLSFTVIALITWFSAAFLFAAHPVASPVGGAHGYQL
jgi:hypothetical protein